MNAKKLEIDGKELIQAYKEAQKAWTDYKFLGIAEDVYFANDCNHPPLTKAGKHDKRVNCKTCFETAYKAQHQAHAIYMDYYQIWQFLKRIGLPVDGDHA